MKDKILEKLNNKSKALTLIEVNDLLSLKTVDDLKSVKDALKYIDNFDNMMLFL